MATYLEIAAAKKRALNWDAVRDVPMPGVMVYDMTKLPMKGVMDNTYNGVYNEHFIEHLTKEEGINFLKEMFRVLSPGGVIRTIWPPMDFVEDFLRSDQDHSQHPFVQHYYNFYVVKHKFAPAGNEHKSLQEQCALGMLHQNGEHKHLWYKEELINTMKELGFKNVMEHEYQKSRISDFRNIDTSGQIRAFHSAVVEGSKPW